MKFVNTLYSLYNILYTQVMSQEGCKKRKNPWCSHLLCTWILKESTWWSCNGAIFMYLRISVKRKVYSHETSFFIYSISFAHCKKEQHENCLNNCRYCGFQNLACMSNYEASMLQAKISLNRYILHHMKN